MSPFHSLSNWLVRIRVIMLCFGAIGLLVTKEYANAEVSKALPNIVVILADDLG